jgi:transposase-like protein
MAEVETSRSGVRSRAFYESLLAEHESSGVSLKALAEAKGIKPATLYAWSRRLRATPPPRPKVEPAPARPIEALLPVQMVRGRPEEERRELGQVQVVVRGDVEVRVPACFDEDVLVRLVEALRARC